ncbi:MAG: ATP-binding protein [Chloroflexota bacterium]
MAFAARRLRPPLTLRAQTITLTVLLALAMLGATTFVIYLDGRSSGNYVAASEAQATQLDLASLEAAMNDAKARLAGYIATSDLQFLVAETGVDDISRLLVKIRKESVQDDQPDVKRLTLAVNAWRGWAANLRAQVLSGVPTPQPKTTLDGQALFDPFVLAYAEVHADVVSDAQGAFRQAKEQTIQQANGTVVAATICISLLLVLIGLFVRSTLTPLRRLVVTAGKLATARPAAIPGLARQDEVGDLARALHRWQSGEANRLLLSTAMAEVSSEVSRTRILEAAVPRLLALFAAREVVISLVEDGVPIVVLSEPNKYVAAGNALGADSPGRRALATGQSLIADLRQPEWDSALQRWGLGPALAMPLVSRGRTLGVATVLRGFDDRGFGEADLHQAEIAGPFVAAAIDAASLFSTLEAANAELGQASRHYSEFLANMSHELRTPLNAILGFSQLLLRNQVPGETGEREVRYVNNIHTSGTHLLSLVSEILDLAQVEAGRVELHKTTVSVHELVELTIAGLEPLANAKGLQLTTSVSPEIELSADRGRLQQILLNLLSNAIKFTPPAGEVDVSASRTTEEVTLSVRDTGCGIAEEDLARVFEKFEQVGGGRMRGVEGTGLGLAVTKALVELHGGTIGLQSELGKGTTVIVRLPVGLDWPAPAKPSQTSPAAAALPVA